MNERGEIERRNNRLRDMEIITQRQGEWLTEQLSPNQSEAELFMDGLRLEVVRDKHLYCLFPARLESNSIGTRHVLQFDNSTIENLVDRFGESYQLTESEIAELYIGTGIAAALLKNSIREQNRKKILRIQNILTDPSDVIEGVRCGDALEEKDRRNIIQGLMQSDDIRLGNINVLRFAFGMVYLQSENLGLDGEAGASGSRETRVMRQFRQGLVQTLINRPQYRQFGRIFYPDDNKDDVTEGDMVGEKVFADAVGEFELAACFPMQWQELAKILRIVK